MSESIDQAFDPGDIAIIGISSRFAGSRNKEEFWENITKGRESITFFDKEELETDETLVQSPAYVRAYGHLDDYDRFDASFFGVTDRTAAMMTPEHRLFLESAWEAMEDGSYDPERVSGEIGIYGSCNPQGIAAYSSAPDLVSAAEEAIQRSLSWLPDCLSSTALFHLGLRGEAMTVTAVCSGFHYAVHLACQSLLLGQTDMAIAGGVMVRLPHRRGHLWLEGRILSRDGHCRPFDEQGTGSVLSSGVATVLLKPLAHAVADRDHIYATVKGTSINNNGVSAMAYGVAQPERLGACIANAMAVGGVAPETVTLLEANGFGIPLTDALELQAAQLAFGDPQNRSPGCAVGSVKGNIGHAGVAAGGSGAVKAALALYHKLLPPTINLDNELSDLENSYFRPQRHLETWEPVSGIRRAGVTAMGGGGYNAHMVLEEAPPRPARAPVVDRPRIANLSARTDTALTRQRAALHKWLHDRPDLRLDDICFSLNLGRKSMERRWAAVVRTRDELLDALRGASEGNVVCVSDGQGEQDGADLTRFNRSAAGLVLGSAADGHDAQALLMLARAWSSGQRVDFKPLHEGDQSYRAPLPNYPFERRRHWRTDW